MKKFVVSCWLLAVGVTMATSARAAAAAVDEIVETAGFEYIDARGRLQTNCTYEAVRNGGILFTVAASPEGVTSDDAAS